jgi:signal transduction histidine kinase
MKMQINLSRRTHLGISLALVILVIIGIVSYRSTVQFTESAAVVSRSHQIISTLEAYMSDVVSVESEVRGYVITGDEGFLRLYRTALAEISDDQVELRRLATDVRVRARLVDLERLTKRRLDRLKSTVETRRLQGLEAIPKTSGEGKLIMDEIREVVNDMESVEHKLLIERDHAAKELASRTIAIVTVATLLTIALTIASMFILRADIAHRERLEKEVLNISEREQRRIGQDLHDGVCQHLTGISLFSRSLQQKLDGKFPGAAREAERITELINDGIEQTRRVTRGLHPVPEDASGLVLALRELSEKVRESTKLPCTFDSPELMPVPDQNAATHLYRIAQEAVQNALRHSGAKSLAIALASNEDAIQLTVRDDGRGIPEDASGKGLGLEIMSYRARSIGATLEIRRAEPTGTIISCTLPRNSLT